MFILGGWHPPGNEVDAKAQVQHSLLIMTSRPESSKIKDTERLVRAETKIDA